MHLQHIKSRTYMGSLRSLSIAGHGGIGRIVIAMRHTGFPIYAQPSAHATQRAVKTPWSLRTSMPPRLIAWLPLTNAIGTLRNHSPVNSSSRNKMLDKQLQTRRSLPILRAEKLKLTGKRRD